MGLKGIPFLFPALTRHIQIAIQLVRHSCPPPNSPYCFHSKPSVQVLGAKSKLEDKNQYLFLLNWTNNCSLHWQKNVSKVFYFMTVEMIFSSTVKLYGASSQQIQHKSQFNPIIQRCWSFDSMIQLLKELLVSVKWMAHYYSNSDDKTKKKIINTVYQSIY